MTEPYLPDLNGAKAFAQSDRAAREVPALLAALDMALDALDVIAMDSTTGQVTKEHYEIMARQVARSVRAMIGRDRDGE